MFSLTDVFTIAEKHRWSRYYLFLHRHARCIARTNRIVRCVRQVLPMSVCTECWSFVRYQFTTALIRGHALFIFSQARMTIHRSSTRGTMRAISVFRDAWAMGVVAIQVSECLNDNQRTSRERCNESRCNFPQTPRRCQVDTKRCDGSSGGVQISMYILQRRILARPIRSRRR